MKSLQDYKNLFREIATNLNLSGDSVEMIVQLLSYASYIEENESIIYAQESSLEKANLMNSKIQLCMNEMYSVYRGQCPRVILNFIPRKYFQFKLFDEIVSSNNFKIYYLGYFTNADNSESNESGTNAIVTDLPVPTTTDETGKAVPTKKCIYGSKTINPSDEPLTIVGLLAPSTKSVSWTSTDTNNLYLNCIEENLSNDCYANKNTNSIEITRNFSEHILDTDNYLYDLTLTSFGSRIYTGGIDINDVISVTYYTFSRLSEYNDSELKKINVRGGEMTSYEEGKWGSKEEIAPGVVLLDATGRDDLYTIHYKAYKDRFTNFILRSNSDIGIILEEMYPNKVASTNYEFNYDTENSDLWIYYVPKDINNPLTEEEKQEFINKRRAYYVTDQIDIEPGIVYNAIINVDLELYKNEDVTNQVAIILESYGNKFGINLKESMEEMSTLISKISNVSKVSNLTITYIGQDGEEVTDEDNINDPTVLDKTYFDIDYVINSIVRTES